MIIAETLKINESLNKAVFKDLSYKSFTALIDLKILLSNIENDKNNFIKTAFDNLEESKKLKELQPNSEEYEKLQKKVLNKLNEIMNLYILKDVDLNITTIKKDELLQFCYSNNFDGKTIELLITLML